MLLRLMTLLVGAVLLCGALCNAQSPAKPSQPVPKSQPEESEVVIGLSRDPGYWDMGPAYSLSIRADGSVVYVGLRNVKTQGMATGRVSPEDVKRLIKEFEKIDYFSLLDEYSHKSGCPFFLWDGANASTSLTSGGKKKSVFHDSGCLADGNGMSANSFPPGLTELENLIDEIVKSKQWIK